jgi:glutamate 5-kinase
MRHPSSQISQILGSMSDPELMHRNNMVFTRSFGNRPGMKKPVAISEPQ